MSELKQTNLYKKELKLMLKRGKSVQKIFDVINLLLDNATTGIEHHLLLPEKYRLHKLTNGLWECHIEPDWLLVYYLDDKVLRLERTGTHSDICNKIKR
jgi:mRNA interferase YafQ